jgi:hypothetical protein
MLLEAVKHLHTSTRQFTLNNNVSQSFLLNLFNQAKKYSYKVIVIVWEREIETLASSLAMGLG